jgi:hypothetical protein
MIQGFTEELNLFSYTLDFIDVNISENTNHLNSLTIIFKPDQLPSLR